MEPFVLFFRELGMLRDFEQCAPPLIAIVPEVHLGSTALLDATRMERIFSGLKATRNMNLRDYVRALELTSRRQ